jgi:hypothetical protein
MFMCEEERFTISTGEETNKPMLFYSFVDCLPGMLRESMCAIESNNRIKCGKMCLKGTSLLGLVDLKTKTKAKTLGDL